MPAPDLISSLESTLRAFQSDKDLSSLQSNLNEIQSQIKPYFSSQQPNKLISEHMAHVTENSDNQDPVIEDTELVYKDLWHGKEECVEHLVAEFLLREGLLEEVELLEREAGLTVDCGRKYEFQGIWHILDSLKERDTTVALQWCNEQLDNGMSDDTPVQMALERKVEKLRFKLHRMRYIQLLIEHGQQNQDATIVVEYARTHLAPFSKQKDFMQQIRSLMGALLYANNLKDSPYAHLLSADSPEAWDEIIGMFKGVACRKMNKPRYSPVYVGALAGSVALPVLLKQAKVVKNSMSHDKWRKYQEADQLSVRIPLPKSFQFRNIFTCPVSHEIATPENPPLLLPCGHVLCKSSVTRITPSRGMSRCRCPYCRSSEFQKSKCQPIHFG